MVAGDRAVAVAGSWQVRQWERTETHEEKLRREGTFFF